MSQIMPALCFWSLIALSAQAQTPSANQGSDACLQRSVEAAQSRWTEDSEEAQRIQAAGPTIVRMRSFLTIGDENGKGPTFIDIEPPKGQSCASQVRFLFDGLFNKVAVVRAIEPKRTRSILFDFETRRRHTIEAFGPVASPDRRYLIFSRTADTNRNAPFAVYDTWRQLRVARFDGKDRLYSDPRWVKPEITWDTPNFVQVGLRTSPEASSYDTRWKRFTLDDIGFKAADDLTSILFVPVDYLSDAQ